MLGANTWNSDSDGDVDGDGDGDGDGNFGTCGRSIRTTEDNGTFDLSTRHIMRFGGRVHHLIYRLQAFIDCDDGDGDGDGGGDREMER